MPPGTICNGYPTPATNKIYVHVNGEFEPNKKLIQIIKSNITYSLLHVTDNVNLIDDVKEASDDGLLLKIIVVYNAKSALSRRVDIKFNLISTSTNSVIYTGKDAYSSKFGYNKVARALGKRTAAKVGGVTKCFELRRSADR